MAMTSFLATLLTLLLVFISFHLLLPPTTCFSHKKLPPSNIKVTSMVEEKTRLGSTPPSCYNKCNNCHPCMAVQVPTMPSHNSHQEGLPPPEEEQEPAAELTAPPASVVENYFDSSPYSGGNNNRYSNYKPLGWKCRCGGHFYNP